jgi:hypothetical protein
VGRALLQHALPLAVGSVVELPEGRPAGRDSPAHAALTEADARTRTGDPFITSEVLYQLSYVGRVGPV